MTALTYEITQDPNGVYVLMLGRQLIGQATKREHLEQVRDGLVDRHPDRKGKE